MAILERISTLLRANINEMLDRAENPEKMIKQLLLDMRSEQLQARTDAALAIAEEQQMARHCEEHLEKIDEWQHKAELAVARGQDDVAREALRRRDAFQQAAERFRQRRDLQAQQIASLQEALAQLESKLEDTETQSHVLIAQHHRAEAESDIRGTLVGTDSSIALAGYERLENKVLGEEARATALRQIQHTPTGEHSTDVEGDATLERELAELKAARRTTA